MTNHDQHEDRPVLARNGAEQIVYVREVRDDELPDNIGERPEGAKIYAIHDVNGARLALTDDRGLAFRLARKHDKVPFSVH